MGNKTQATKLPIWAVRIKALRLKLEESQQQFGDRFGVTKQAVGQWESGKSEPSPDVILWVVEHD